MKSPFEHFEVRPSGIEKAGMGLFSKICLHPGEVIGDYTGERLTDEEANSDAFRRSRYLVYICKDHWINGEGEKANHTRYVNHDGINFNSRLSTSLRWKTARIIATQTIRPGDEIFMDYGEEYWESLSLIEEEASMTLGKFLQTKLESPKKSFSGGPKKDESLFAWLSRERKIQKRSDRGKVLKKLG